MSVQEPMSIQENSAGIALPLRLMAFDAEDLAIVSANLQDAVVQAADMAWQPQARRFVMALARFDWVAAAHGRLERCGTGLHFDCVRHASFSGFALGQQAAPMTLLFIHFEPTDQPSGMVVLTFSGAAVIRLEVECLDAQMRDIGPRWAVDHLPGDAAGVGETSP